MAKSNAAKKKDRLPKSGPVPSAIPLPMSPSPIRWLTNAETIKMLGISGGRLYTIVRDGLLQAYQRGRMRYFKEEDVKAYLVPKPLVIHQRRKRGGVKAAKVAKAKLRKR